MRLTIRTSLAMRTLMFCAVNPDRIVRRQDIAEACAASENHLAQVIHSLALSKYLHTIRGRAGGVMLGRPAEQISVGQVFRDFEKVLPFSDCIGEGGGPGKGDCCMMGCCRLTAVLTEALDAFYATLDRVTLADLVADNHALARLLRLDMPAF